MSLVQDYPVVTLVPPLIAIALVLLTRRVLISLGVGVLSAALLVADFQVWDWLVLVAQEFAAIFWVDGALNTGDVYILIFTLMLGVVTAFVLMSGGTRAFAQWAITRIRTRRGATALPAVLGLVIFIDDYFNALAVGQVSRPVTDAHRVSRAKLSYIIDSTSAPIAVLAPFSSWGAYIIGLIGPLVAASTLNTGDLQAFIGAALTNYYAIAAVLLVWVVVITGLDLGPMRREERRALEEGKPYDEDTEIPGKMDEDLPVHEPGAVRALVVPFVALVIGVLGGIVWTGYQAAGGWDWVTILAETDVATSLVLGGSAGVVFAIAYYLRYTTSNPRFGSSTFGRAWWEGIRSMLPAVTILVLAWILSSLVEQLGTGQFLADLVESSGLSPSWLIPVMFLCAFAMAFATGTSWGSFGILLPIAGAIMNSLDTPELLLPAFGAVLAGAVFGDHSSPISDTTILSATGAGANVITHVMTQLPYAGLGAAAALLGYVSLAITSSWVVGLVVTVVVVVVVGLVARSLVPPVTAERTSAPAGESA